MRMIIVIVITSFFAVLPLPGAFAQTPTVQMFFDEQLQVSMMECPGFVFDTLYVVASGFDTQIVDVEYVISLNGHLDWYADLLPPTYTAVGISVTGIVVSFPEPVDANGPFLIQRIIAQWICVGCPQPGIPFIAVEPHPTSGKVQATRWPDMTKVEAEGIVNLLCPVLPVEKTTWGQVKALYR